MSCDQQVPVTFESHNVAKGLHIKITRITEDTLVTTVRAMMIYTALFHVWLVPKIRSRKREIDSLVNVLEITEACTAMSPSFTIKDICLGDR